MRAQSAYALAAAALLASAPARGGSLHYTDVAQDATYLCWAAAGETAWSALAGGKTKCTIVANAVKPECCVSGNVVTSDPTCDVATPFGLGDYMPKQLLAWSTSLPSSPGARLYPSLALLRHEIDIRKRPVVVWWRYGAPCAQAGHLVTAVGLQEQTNPAQVLVSDPRPGNSKWMDLTAFQCGPVGRGQCTIYYGVGPSQEDYADVTAADVACSEAVVSAEAKTDSSKVEQSLFAKLLVEMAEPLGLPTVGAMECSSEDQILVEYQGSPGYRHLLLECERSGTPFLAAVRPANPIPELLWYGEKRLASALASARGVLLPGPGRLVLRIDPVSGDVTLYRAGSLSPGVVLRYPS